MALVSLTLGGLHGRIRCTDRIRFPCIRHRLHDSERKMFDVIEGDSMGEYLGTGSLF
jgi:hypothetical protein